MTTKNAKGEVLSSSTSAEEPKPSAEVLKLAKVIRSMRKKKQQRSIGNIGTQVDRLTAAKKDPAYYGPPRS